MTRLFLALPLPEDEAVSLRQSREGMKISSPRIRWTEADQYHITLLFFGETESADIPVICEAVDRAAELFSPPVLKSTGPGQFPVKGQPRVIVEHLADTGVPGSTGECSSLHQFLYSILSPRFSLEKRKFRPHITLARVRRGRGELPLQAQDVSEGQCLHPRELVLFESILKPEGALYAPVYSRLLEG